MTYENIKEKLKTVWYSVWGVLAGVHYCFTAYLRMAQFIGDFLSLLLFKEEAADTLHSTEMEHQDLEDLQLWNSFSYYPSVTVFDFLKGQRCKYFSKTKNKLYHGEYLFTVDWAHPESNILDTEHSEIPDQHKCGHVLALDNGNYAVMPNNRILWSIPSFTTSSSVPDYKVQTTIWNVENKGLITEDTDKFFYDIISEEKKNK
jgi:hypothetical protein